MEDPKNRIESFLKGEEDIRAKGAAGFDTPESIHIGKTPEKLMPIWIMKISALLFAIGVTVGIALIVAPPKEWVKHGRTITDAFRILLFQKAEEEQKQGIGYGSRTCITSALKPWASCSDCSGSDQRCGGDGNCKQSFVNNRDLGKCTKVRGSGECIKC